MHDRPLTMDDYLAARMISRPLRLFDFCLETDGACGADRHERRAGHGRAQPAGADPRRGAGQRCPTRSRASSSRSCCARTSPRCRPSRPPTRSTGGPGSGPADIDVAQLYDCFTITVLLQLEDFGFCAKGEGGAFVSSGAIELGGSLPINTGGGHLSEGYIHGMNHIVEGVRQIRGTSTGQVAGRRDVPRHEHPAPARQRPDPAEGLMSDGLLQPVDDDHDTGGFFEAAAPGRAGVRACSACGAVLHVPAGRTAGTCGSWDGEWRPVAGTGTLHSWTVADHQVHPAYPVPYTIVLVDLDDAPGVRLVGYLPGSSRPPRRHADAGALRRARRRRRAPAVGAGGSSDNPVVDRRLRPERRPPCWSPRSTASRSSTPTPT